MLAVRRRLLLIALATPLIVVGGALPVGAAQPRATASAPESTGLQPSIHWEQARAHADDKLDLPAGDRVTVGFSPRPADLAQ